MLDWFDPGIDEQDLRAMGKTRQQYAASRLQPSSAALNAYTAAGGGARRITMLTSGMRHTAFTDDLLSSASSDSQRARYAEYLTQIRVITLNFFELVLNGDLRNSVCATPVKETYTQCFEPSAQLAPR